MTPLAIAVCDEDYYLTKYLLQHGADPKVLLFDEPVKRQYETFLVDYMFFVLEDARGERAHNAETIVQLLSDGLAGRN